MYTHVQSINDESTQRADRARRSERSENDGGRGEWERRALVCLLPPSFLPLRSTKEPGNGEEIDRKKKETGEEKNERQATVRHALA